ncbi:MAG: polyprenyl diphosphate synthase [Bacilli bacterium]
MHIGIILDGNRRWAKEKNLPSLKGHEKGAKAIENLVKNLYEDNLGINILTIYAFSTENFNRSDEEVYYLCKLFKQMIKKLTKNIKDKNVKVNICGDKSLFTEGLQKELLSCENITKNNNGLIFNICLGYSGRLDIVSAVKKIVDKGIKSEDITEQLISDNLYTKGLKDPDMIIRTSGENRLSNFLTYQSAYSELIFIKKYWPDFDINTLKECLKKFNKRNRRFGK